MKRRTASASRGMAAAWRAHLASTPIVVPRCRRVDRKPRSSSADRIGGIARRSLAALLVVVATMAMLAGPSMAQGFGPTEVHVPGIAIVVDEAGPGLAPEEWSSLIEELGAVEGVARAVAGDQLDGATVIALSLIESGPEQRPVDSVATEARELIADAVPDATVAVGGSALVDTAIESRFRSGLIVLTVVGALLGLASGVVFGRWQGVITGTTVAIAVLVAGVLGGRVIEPFDGTLAATVVPGALAGLAIALVVSLRILVWFRGPTGADGAEMVRAAIADLAPELTLTLSGLVVTGLLVDFLDPGRTAFLVPVAGAAVSAVIVLAVLPASLALLSERRTTAEGPRADLLPLSIPDGADLRFLALGACVAALAGLSLFALDDPARQFLDHGNLSESDEAAIVADRLEASGDPTAAIVAVANENTSPAALADWARLVAERPDVAWVDTGSSRVSSSGPQAVSVEMLLVPPDAERTAMIVPSVASRSVEGQGLVDGLAAVRLAGGTPTFTGTSVDAFNLAGQGSVGLVAVLLLAAIGGLAAAALTQSTTYAASCALLRLLSGGATLGIYRLIVPGATMADSVVALVIVAIPIGLFELEFARTILEEGGTPYRSTASRPGAYRRPSMVEAGVGSEGSRDPNRGQFAALGLAGAAIGGFLLAFIAPFDGGPGAGLFGLGLMVAVVVELTLGFLIARPAVLAQRGAFHTAIRPLRLALHADNSRKASSADVGDDPTWRRIVGDLLQTEFRLQTDPDDADLDTVFLAATPLHRQAARHQSGLATAGLRVAGRCPKLRSVRTISGRTQTTLAITVDHPERQLVDGDGLVVGLRRPERRSGVLWLADAVDGSYRIAESIELGSVPLDTDADDDVIDLGWLDTGPDDVDGSSDGVGDGSAPNIRSADDPSIELGTRKKRVNEAVDRPSR